MVNAYLLEEQAQGGHDAASDGGTLRGNYGDRFTGAEDVPEDPGPARGRRWLLLALVGVLAAIIVLIVWWMRSRGDEQVPVETGKPAISAPVSDPEASPVEPSVEPPVEPAADEDPKEKEQAVVAEQSPPPDPAPETQPVSGPLQVEITLARPTIGRLNCDNRQVELLDRLAAGVTMGFSCERFLIIDAEDGGALLLSRSGGEPTPLAGDGVALHQHRLTPDGEVE
jgi:hypothetical protein